MLFRSVESGDILHAVGKGRMAWSQVRNVGEVVAGKLKAPIGDGIILFESHGLAVQDVAVSLAAYDLARQRGIGRQVQL